MIVDTIVGGALEPPCANAPAGVAHEITRRRRPAQRHKCKNFMSLLQSGGHIIAAGYLSEAPANWSRKETPDGKADSIRRDCRGILCSFDTRAARGGSAQAAGE